MMRWWYTNCQFAVNCFFWESIHITYLSTAKQGDNRIGSVCPSFCPIVRLCVCLSSPAWTVWPLTLNFGMRVDLDLDLAGIVGQGCRSKVKVKCSKSFFTLLLVAFYLNLRPRSKVGVKVKCLACSGQYHGLGLPRWSLPVWGFCLWVCNQEA